VDVVDIFYSVSSTMRANYRKLINVNTDMLVIMSERLRTVVILIIALFPKFVTR